MLSFPPPRQLLILTQLEQYSCELRLLCCCHGRTGAGMLVCFEETTGNSAAVRWRMYNAAHAPLHLRTLSMSGNPTDTYSTGSTRKFVVSNLTSARTHMHSHVSTLAECQGVGRPLTCTQSGARAVVRCPQCSNESPNPPRQASRSNHPPWVTSLTSCSATRSWLTCRRRTSELPQRVNGRNSDAPMRTHVDGDVLRVASEVIVVCEE